MIKSFRAPEMQPGDEPPLVIEPREVTVEIRNLVETFTSSDNVGQRYLFGRNEHSAALAKIFSIAGFVDDFTVETVWHGKPVVKSEAVPNEAIIVNCVMCIRPVSAFNKIKHLRTRGALNYADLFRVFPDRVPCPKFVEDSIADFNSNRTKWFLLRNALADGQSRQILDDLLNYRLTGDLACMAGYSVRPSDQYFEEFLNLNAGEVFVDCGGFDGDTSEEFCRRCPDYGKVYLFEPSAKNIQRARTRLSGLRSIEFIDKGLSDVGGVLGFDPDSGSASAVSESGSCQIKVTTLDGEVREKVSFVKMDLEGWEMKALLGSRRHILQDYPKLAICVYHHPSDFWRLFEFVIGVRSDYKVYLRHYTEGWSETVMYFVPSTQVGNAASI